MNVRTKLGSLVALCFVLGVSLFLTGSALQVPSGTWQATGSMSESRDGAAAVALPDGRVLVIGGDNGSGPTASVDIFGATGVFSAGANMLSARSGHTATRLSDGRVLVVGGTSGGAATASAEIYDPASDSWSNAASLNEARSGAVAVALENSQVLVAGGSGAGGALKSIEIYDEASDSWSVAGNMSKARVNAAAATLGRWPTESNRLIDRQVIIVGGSNGGSALASTDVYDVKSGQISAGPALPGPRKNASAVTVLGGYVYVAGGNDGSNDLSSAVLISRDGNVTAAANLLAPRSGHFAVRLPGANSVLIAGGSAGTSAEVFIPWSNTQISTGSMGSSRVGGASASVSRGLYLAAGGSGSSSSEVYGYATIDSDKNDYSPGETVSASGSGWDAGEIVTLVLHEDVTEPFHPDITVPLLADLNGNIAPTSIYLVEDHDRGIRFFLTATGATSGHQARATFTDAASADLDQCRNGDSDTPTGVESVDCKDSTGGWVNGNVGEQNAHMAEGLSIPYRARLEQVPTDQGEIDIYLSYDTKHSDKVAIDHLTHYQCLEPHLQFGHPSEVVDPGDTFGGYTGDAPDDTFAIPPPSFIGAPAGAPGAPTFAGSLNDCTRTMSIWGGTISQIAYDTPGNPGGAAEGESTYADGVNQATTFIRIRFQPTSANVLLGWGGHIASRVDWGFDANGVPRSAGGISGSPYHMRLEDWRFANTNLKVTNLGNQDRSLSAAAVIPTGTIKIIKNAIPNSDQDFTFTASGTGAINPTNFTLDDNGNDGDGTSSMISFTVLSGNTFDFVETNIPNGWQLTNRACVLTGQGLTPNQQSVFTNVGGATIQVELEDGEDVECTFTDTGSGHIIVDKVTVPSGSSQSFDFDASGGLYADFSLTDAATPNDQSLIPGNYSVTETVPAGWDLTSVNCVSSIADTEVNTALELDPGETITCTFTNTQRGKIIIDKVTDPSGDPQVFDFSLTGGPDSINQTPSLDDNDTPHDSGFIKPGSYSAEEINIPSNWALTSVSCDDDDGEVTSNPASLDLDPGETITCVFTNTKNGKIIIEKQTIPDGATQSFTFTGDVAGSLTDGQTAMEEVAPGSYTSTETVPAGWTLKGIVCDDSDSAADGTIEEQANFEVAPGEEVTCVFTNIKNPFITIEADDTNEVNDDHTFTVFVGQFDGVSNVGIPGVEVTVSFSPSDPGTITGNPCTTDANGECEVTINSAVAGVFTATASATVDIMGVQFPISTDDTGENSGPATKTYVDASIALTPQEAANQVGDQHEIIATVTEDPGTGPVPAENELVTFVITSGDATFVGGVDTCTTDAAGMCSVFINDSTPGNNVIDASVNVSVGGLSLLRDTAGNSGPDGSDAAEKLYVDARISITPTETNEVGTPHNFVVTVEADTGSGFAGVLGAIVDVDVQPAPDGGLDETDCADGTDASGQCTATINSSVAGVFTANATATIDVSGVQFVLSTDGSGGSSGPAVKTYVEAKITLDPLEATNNINDPHTITATVMVDDGGGFDPAPDGTLVTFSLLNNTANADFIPTSSDNTCTTVGGACSVMINSSSPGSVDIHASTDVMVGGLTLHRETDSTHGSSGNANKIYVAGKIIVIKECEPANDEQLFTFAGPGAIDEAQLACFTNGHSSQVDSGFLAPGNYEVSETVPDGWDLTSIVCDDDDNSGGLVDIPAVDLVLDAGETITCTFHNVKRGNLIVRKINLGRADAGFPIFGYFGDPTLPDAADGGPGSVNNSPGAPHANADFSLQTEQTGADPLCQGIFNASQFATADCTGQADVSGILPGSQVFFEQQPNPVTWRLLEIVCESDDQNDTTTTHINNGSVVDGMDTPPNGGRVDLDLDPGETITCTFVNQFGGRIRVVKQTDPDGSTQEFDFFADYVNKLTPCTPDATEFECFSLTDADTSVPPVPNHLSDWQPPGSYNIDEELPAGWDFDGASCVVESGPGIGDPVGTPTSTGVTVPVDGGQVIVCTFNNTQLGRIKLNKTVVFGDVATEFDFDNNGPDSDFVDCQLHHGEMCDTGFTLSPGVYTAKELVLLADPDGAWRLDNFAEAAIQCTIVQGDGNGTSVTFSGAAMGDTDVFEAGDDTANITLGSGGFVECTFFNRLGGFIKIVKACDPEVDPTNAMFEFDTDIVRTDDTHPQDPTLMCGGMHLTLWQPVDSVENGTAYNVTELVPPAGWTLTDLVCDDDASTNPSVEDVANRHATINLDGGETVTCTFTNTLEQFEGCTPGYWKNHTGLGPQGNAWEPTPYNPGDALTSVWSIPTCVSDADDKIDDATLLQALSFKGGSGVGGAARNLLRAAVAALLNASHPDVTYPRSEADVIADVQAALDSCDRNAMLTLAGELDEDNNLGCPLSNPTTASGDDPVAPTPVADVPTQPSAPAAEGASATDSSFTQPSSEPSSFRLSLGGAGGTATEEPKPAVEAAKSQITSVSFKDGVLELSGVALDRTGKPLTGVVGLTLAFYSEKDGAPVWLDLHNVELDSNGNYTLRLTLTEGVLQLEPSWLGVQVQGQAEQPRVSLR